MLYGSASSGALPRPADIGGADYMPSESMQAHYQQFSAYDEAEQYGSYELDAGGEGNGVAAGGEAEPDFRDSRPLTACGGAQPLCYHAQAPAGPSFSCAEDDSSGSDG